MDIIMSAAEIELVIGALRRLHVRASQSLNDFDDAIQDAKQGGTPSIELVGLKIQQRCDRIAQLRNRFRKHHLEAIALEQRQEYMPFFRNMDGKWQRVPGYGCYSQREADTIVTTLRKGDPVTVFQAFKPEDIL